MKEREREREREREVLVLCCDSLLHQPHCTPGPTLPGPAAVGHGGEGGPDRLGGDIDGVGTHQAIMQSPKRLHKALEGICPFEHLEDLEAVPHPQMSSSTNQ